MESMTGTIRTGSVEALCESQGTFTTTGLMLTSSRETKTETSLISTVKNHNSQITKRWLLLDKNPLLLLDIHSYPADYPVWGGYAVVLFANGPVHDDKDNEDALDLAKHIRENAPGAKVLIDTADWRKHLTTTKVSCEESSRTWSSSTKEPIQSKQRRQLPVMLQVSRTILRQNSTESSGNKCP